MEFEEFSPVAAINELIIKINDYQKILKENPTIVTVYDGIVLENVHAYLQSFISIMKEAQKANDEKRIRACHEYYSMGFGLANHIIDDMLNNIPDIYKKVLNHAKA